MDSSDSAPSSRQWFRTLEEARRHSNSFFFLDCENEIPLTSSIRHVKCSEDALELLCEDLALFGLLTDATNCIYYSNAPSDWWSKEQCSGDIWVAPEYEPVLGPAIRRLLSGAAEDIYNDCFNPAAHFFSNYPKYDRGETPMYLAAQCGDWDGTFARMLRCAPDINARNTDGNTPLHGAASRGHATVVERLISLKADVNAKGARCRTPLHLAIIDQNCKRPPPIDAALLLVRAGADVNAPDEVGLTPLECLIRWCPDQKELEHMLLVRGAIRSPPGT